MIEWREVAQGPGDLRIYRVDAESEGVSFGGKSGVDPLSLIFQTYPNATTRLLREEFAERRSPVNASSFSVACHVVSLPDTVWVIDSTYRTTAPRVFPDVLEQIVASEARHLADRRLRVLYTHAHFDHAGGHLAVESLDSEARVFAHPYTRELFPVVSRRESFILTKGQFLRDCEIDVEPEAISERIREHFLQLAAREEIDLDAQPWGSLDEGPLRIDEVVEPGEGGIGFDAARVEVFRFDGHIPGHLCVLVDKAHLITGDMWLPATTSLVTPGSITSLAGVAPEQSGLLRYLESSERLLAMSVDDCVSYPSHEVIFRNPKRMAMRDLEIFAARFEPIGEVLRQHPSRPMRVLDLAWGGANRLPIWNVGSSHFRLAVAHDEASAYVSDLVTAGDLREVEPERFVWTGREDVRKRVVNALESARVHHGHLEFRSRGRAS